MRITRERLIAALRDPDVNHVLHAYSYTEEQQADAILAFLSRDSAETISLVAGNVRGFAAWLGKHSSAAQIDAQRLQRAMREAHGRRAFLTETYAQAIARRYNALLQDERESSLGRDAEGHLVLSLGPGVASPSTAWERYDGLSPLEQRTADGDR